jgi:hypothetical protein
MHYSEGGRRKLHRPENLNQRRFSKPFHPIEDAKCPSWSNCDIVECPHHGSFTTESRHSIAPQYLTHWSSRPEEFHLQALPEPCVNLSIHTAPDVRPLPCHSCQ